MSILRYAQQASDLRGEVTRVDRLREVAIEPSIQNGFTVTLHGIRGNRQNWQSG
jgi:hypothetical protein